MLLKSPAWTKAQVARELINGDADLAVSTLLGVLLETTHDEGILVYADALDYYKDNLDETLDG